MWWRRSTNTPTPSRSWSTSVTRRAGCWTPRWSGRTRACAGTRHVLRLQRATDRPRRTGGARVLGRIVRRQCRSGAPHLGSCRRRGPGHLCGGNHRRRRSERWTRCATSTDSVRAPWTSCSSTTTRMPTCPTCSASPSAACCIGVDRRRRQRRVPGSPKYRAYMREQQGRGWNTVEHRTHMEYQTLVPDLVWSPICWVRRLSGCLGFRLTNDPPRSYPASTSRICRRAVVLVDQRIPTFWIPYRSAGRRRGRFDAARSGCRQPLPRRPSTRRATWTRRHAVRALRFCSAAPKLRE